MPKKYICKNHCDGCMYEPNYRESEVCLCGLYPYYDDNDEPGCNYKESTLSKLYRYTKLELDEAYSFRYDDLYYDWDQAKHDIEWKKEIGEEVSAQEEENFKSLSEKLRVAKNMNFDHKRCNYIRLINELDEKGAFKRHLKKLGRYPEFIDDLTIGIEKEEM